jgi:polar amino acid transport system substrate-binding protein
VGGSPRGASGRCSRRGIAAFFMAMATGSHVAADPCTLLVGWEPYAVFTYDGGDGQPVGVDIDMMRRIGQHAGCAIEFRELPWTRILLELQAGRIDATTSVQHTPERDGFAYFSIPYRKGELALYTRKGQSSVLRINSMNDWADTGKRLGVILGYSYGSDVDRMLARPEVVALTDVAPDYATAIRMLVSGRTDAFLSEDVNVMVGEAVALGVADAIERHPAHVPATEYHVMFSRETVPPEVVSAADQVIDRMKRSGELDALIEHHRSYPPVRAPDSGSDQGRLEP